MNNFSNQSLALGFGGKTVSSSRLLLKVARFSFGCRWWRSVNQMANSLRSEWTTPFNYSNQGKAILNFWKMAPSNLKWWNWMSKKWKWCQIECVPPEVSESQGRWWYRRNKSSIFWFISTAFFCSSIDISRWASIWISDKLFCERRRCHFGLNFSRWNRLPQCEASSFLLF